MKGCIFLFFRIWPRPHLKQGANNCGGHCIFKDRQSQREPCGPCNIIILLISSNKSRISFRYTREQLNSTGSSEISGTQILLQIRMPVTDNAATVREIQDESSINTRVDG